jgi:hypothetical protein
VGWARSALVGTARGWGRQDLRAKRGGLRTRDPTHTAAHSRAIESRRPQGRTCRAGPLSLVAAGLSVRAASFGKLKLNVIFVSPRSSWSVSREFGKRISYGNRSRQAQNSVVMPY